MNGRVSTFYSFKGGSGRSMAMANVAWAMATNGERVLAIDWDLEAPGLHRYFHPFMADPQQSRSDGLVDRIWNYLDALEDPLADRFALAKCDDLVQQLDLPVELSGSGGCLDFLGAGKQNDDYSRKVGGLDWSAFYGRFDGQAFVDRLMSWARGRYTQILIDSRTGVADSAGVCTAQVPDALVMCMVYNRQSIEGTAAVLESVYRTRDAWKLSPLDVMVLPSRVEDRSNVESARRYAAAQLSRPLKADRGKVERQFRRDEIRHYPWCAFEEKLAVFEDVPGEPGSLLEAMHSLSQRVTGRTLRIAPIEPEVLAGFWRRAAFDDPRLAEIEALAEVGVEVAHEQITLWLQDAGARRDERADWLMALGEAAVSAAGIRSSSGGTLHDLLGRGGLRVANRAYEADPFQYRTRFATLLQDRASQLQRARSFDQALELIERAASLFSEDDSPTARWRQARSLEQMADIMSARGQIDASLDIQSRAVAIYDRMDLRSLPLGAAMAPARAFRRLAERLAEVGRTDEGKAVAERAVELVRPLADASDTRSALELANILAVTAEIAVEIGGADADREIMRARVRGNQMLLGHGSVSYLERRLRHAEIKLAVRRGEIAEVKLRLRELAEEDYGFLDPGTTADLARLLLKDGDPEKALELLLIHTRNRAPFVTHRITALMKETLQILGRDDEFVEFMVQSFPHEDPNDWGRANLEYPQVGRRRGRRSRRPSTETANSGETQGES